MMRYSLGIFVLLIGSIGAAEEVLGPPLLTLAAHPDIVTSVGVSPDGSKFVSVDDREGASVIVWNSATASEILRVEDEDSYHAMSAFTPDSKRLLTIGAGSAGSHDPYIARFWDIETGVLIRSHDLTDLLDGSYHPGPLYFSSDGRRVLSVSGVSNRDEDFGGALWEAESGEQLYKFTIHEGQYPCGAYSADGKRVVLGGQSGAHLWIADSEFGVRVFELSNESVGAVAFSADDSEALIAGSNSSGDQVRIFDANNGQLLSQYECNARLWRLGAFSNLSMLFGSRNRLWDWRTGEPLARLPDRLDITYSVAFTPDSTKLVTGHNDGTIHIWDISHLAAQVAVPEWNEH